MAEKEGGKEFPDVTQKLSAPKKLSAFEKDRQAEKAKRLRAQEEDAAALREFEDSFGDEDEDDGFMVSRGRGPPAGPRGGFGGTGSRYGMPPAGPKSGPGSLGPMPGIPPPDRQRKRKALEEMMEAEDDLRSTGLLGQSAQGRHGPQGSARGLAEDDEAPKPTLHLSGMKPDCSSSDVRHMLDPHLNVHSVQILAAPQPASAYSSGPSMQRSRATVSALAMLEPETKSQQIDTTISALKGKYLGSGLYLSISRHLSSTSLHPGMSDLSSSTPAHPFGAVQAQSLAKTSMRAAPPPPEHMGFAPPASYGHGGRNQGHGMPAAAAAVVAVEPPSDIETMRAIHVVAERLLAAENPEDAVQLEATIMAMPEVEQDERFAFLYDSQSSAGVYYRYLLWAPDHEDDQKLEAKRKAKSRDRIWEDIEMEWVPPYECLPFMDLQSLSDAVTHMDYVSSDEESDGDDTERRFHDGRESRPPIEGREKSHLQPVKYARLVHLLSRLPTSNARLRKGDVARVTNFAINHAGEGAEEIVNLLLLNVERPFSYLQTADSRDQGSGDDYQPDEELPSFGEKTEQPQRDDKREDDPSNSKLIALYVISDILSASSTAGARNAWKYRQLFEAGFRARQTFEHLGKLEKELGWGRMKAEQWKRKIGVLFGIWEGWSVFSSDVHEELKKGFFEPPLSEAEKAAEQEAKEKEEKRLMEEKWKGKFKRVEHAASPSESASPAAVPTPKPAEGEDVDGTPMDDLDGQPMDEVDGTPMEDVDGAPMTDDVDGAPMNLDDASTEKPVEPASAMVGFSMAANAAAQGAPKPSGPKRRMRAEDMFADSDEE